ICGYGDFCKADICISNCNATAACGKDASTPGASCPLNGDNCGPPTVPSCSSNDILKRVIGYYEGWANNRTYDS
ncbi:bacteriodes thetaiotaomicron symbiotic chitinase, partial [Penicillium maclennaniae]|uniref:bacteriodes thetaiotaomicron symbiotic chitinase n=1 Tax=Penicillium maclennaniae TaxID=1343394 RepID=UPI0025412293